LDCQGFVQNCFNSVFEEKDIDLNDDRQLMNPAMIFTNNCMFGFTDDNPILFELEKKYDKIKFLLCIEDVYKITPIVLWSKVFYKFFIKNNIAIDTTLQEYLSTKILKTKHMNFHANCTIYHEGCQNTDLKKYRIDKANPYAQHMPTSGTKYMYEILGAEAVKDYHSYM
jgi:hypothetical protein